ncbi:MAG TPA: SAM-dependent methyltransferase [Polyangiaceae bacterium]|jgi:predicted methyltransferase|nr:SAM-dependent methyltransferase [Polyangiaceae bacterium]
MKERFSALLFLLVSCASGPKTAAPAAPSDQATPPPSAEARTLEKRPQAEPISVPSEIQALVDAADRSAEDKALDAGRHPGELLSFIGLKPGMKVGEIGAGGGYTSELLARGVGPSGTVYGENTPAALEKFVGKPWSERLAKPVMKNVIRADREIDDPFPPEAKDLDAVVCVLIYHDLFWLGGDRDKMNAAVFKALKSGGVYVIVDHSGRPGSAATEVKTLHRIEESVVRQEIERAGFKLLQEGFFLRNPQDERDWNDSPKSAGERRGTSDRFALKYVKP